VQTSAALSVGGGVTTPGTTPSFGQPASAPPPTPFELSSGLDYECRNVSPAAPPVPMLPIRQLNPVLKDQIPQVSVQLEPLQQLCVPVAKNNRMPPAAARPFVEASDIACYQASAPEFDVDLKLTHLNPVLAGLPNEFVRITQLQQVCFPVRKNAQQMTAQVRNLDSYIDQACYHLEEPTTVANQQLDLKHLNPVIAAWNYPDRHVVMQRAKTLCVPIAKNENVPTAVQDVVQWLDFLKYDVDVVAGAGPAFQLTLTHMNPLFNFVPSFPVTVYPEPIQLMVPVEKNDRVPPGAGPL
jgi:hypothetical protein